MKKRSLLYRIGRPRPVPVDSEREEPKHVQADLTTVEVDRLRDEMARAMGTLRRFIDAPDGPPVPPPGPRAAIRYVPSDAPEHFPDIVRVLEAAVADASRRFVGGPLTTSVLSMVAAHLRTGIEMYHRTAARLMELTYRVSVFVWDDLGTLNVEFSFVDVREEPPAVSSDFRNLVVQSGFGTQPGRVMGIDWGVDADEVGRSAARAFAEEARQIRAAAALEDGRAAARWAAPELGVPLQEPPATVYAPFVPVRSVRSTNDDLVDAINFQIEANNPAFVSPPLMPLLIEQQRQMVEQAPEEDATLGEVTPEMLRDEAFRMLQDTVANRSQNRRANRLARNLLRQQYCECQGNLMCRFCLTRENTQED